MTRGREADVVDMKTRRSRSRTFTTSTGEYQCDELVVPASDAKGHNERFQLRLQPQMLEAMASWVATQQFPYDSVSGVIRRGIMLALKEMEQLEPRGLNVVAAIEFANKTLRTSEINRKLDDTLDAVSAEVASLIVMGEKAAARKLILQHWKLTTQMEKGVWRARMQRELKRRFSDYLKGRKVSLRGA